MTKGTLDVASIGEEISGAEGRKMILDYREQHPGNAEAYQVGKRILEKILGQPGCEGVRFYNSMNELNEQTLVYVGVDAGEKVIAAYTEVGTDGSLLKRAGIIADRIKPPKDPDTLEWGLPE